VGESVRLVLGLHWYTGKFASEQGEGSRSEVFYNIVTRILNFVCVQSQQLTTICSEIELYMLRTFQLLTDTCSLILKCGLNAYLFPELYTMFQPGNNNGANELPLKWTGASGISITIKWGPPQGSRLDFDDRQEQ
jgi:hypothetical protein